MDRLLDHTQQPDTYQAQLEHTIVLTFYETGMRLSELTSLDDNSVDYARSEIRVHGKGNKQRAIPFGDELAQACVATPHVATPRHRRAAPRHSSAPHAARA